jgi:hypothetical protein
VPVTDVDASRMNANQHVVDPNLGRVDVLELENVG